MTVLHVIPSVSLANGGPSRALITMECALSKLGVNVTTVATDDDGPGQRLKISPSPDIAGVTRIYFRKRLEFYKAAPGLLPWLWRHVQDYDVLHIHALFTFTSIAAAWVARIRDVPYVLRPLGTLTHYGVTQRRPWLKRLSLALLEGPALRNAAAVHFTSQSEWDEAASLGIPMRGVVIPLGIEAATPSDGVLIRQQYPALAGARYMLYLSRLDPKKNLEGLLRGFGLCSLQWPDVKLLVAGSGAPEYVAGLMELANELGLHERVVWTGHIDGDLKASALAGAELFVLPSYSENFGIAAAEALMAGLPCVLGQGVALSAPVVQAGAGIVVGTDAESIASAMRYYLDAGDLRDCAGVAALALAQREYSVDKMGGRLVGLYESILRQTNRAEPLIG